MKVLIAVLSTRESPYGEMIETSKATWDSVDVPGVETIFYVGHPASPLHEKVLGVPVHESLFTIGHKNLQAWKWMLDNIEFDFMARVNASCYVHKARLLEHCRSLLPAGLITGGQVRSDHGEPVWLWGGHQMILSRDVVQAMVDHPEAWPHTEMDDVAMSRAAVTLGFELAADNIACSIDRVSPDEWQVSHAFSFTDWADVAKLDRQVFFRVKQDLRRHEDAIVMKNLFANLLP